MGRSDKYQFPTQPSAPSILTAEPARRWARRPSSKPPTPWRRQILICHSL